MGSEHVKILLTFFVVNCCRRHGTMYLNKFKNSKKFLGSVDGFDEQNHKSVKSTDVYLSKESGSFGFTIRGGSYGPYSEKSRPLTVTHVRPGGPADREGKIRVGDRLIGIDGIDISTCTLNAALTLLRKCKERNVCLTLEYDVAILEINKATGLDFGLNLKFRHSTQGKIVVVDSVAEASLADRCGAIKIGDEIISVDQMTLEYSTLPEVHQLLKNNDQDRIKLEIRRYGDHLSLLKNRRESSSDAEPNSEDKNEEKINVSTNDSRYGYSLPRILIV
uniref:PDZ domain-containing protein n=1 Tax=Romanomermis culicivorax TaxID=13658 RepID=A0A915I855_ROMCU